MVEAKDLDSFLPIELHQFLKAGVDLVWLFLPAQQGQQISCGHTSSTSAPSPSPNTSPNPSPNPNPYLTLISTQP